MRSSRDEFIGDGTLWRTAVWIDKEYVCEIRLMWGEDFYWRRLPQNAHWWDLEYQSEGLSWLLWWEPSKAGKEN